MRKWTVDDGRGNSITVTAENRAKAREAVRRRFPKMQNLTVSAEGRASKRTTVKGSPRRVATVPQAAKKQGPNDRCPCGSQKKWKHCCMKRQVRSAAEAKVSIGSSRPWPPVQRSRRGP